MKTGGIIKIVIGSIVAVLLVLLMLGLFLGRGIFRMADYTGVVSLHDDGATPVDTTATIEAAGIRSVRIEWLSGSVRVVEGTGDGIVLTEKFAGTLTDKERMRYTVEDGELTIKYRADTTGNWMQGVGTDLRKSLTVELPASLVDSLDLLRIETVSADALVNGISARETKLEAVSGSHEVSGITGEKLSASSVSGEFRVKDCTLNELDMESVSGSLYADGTFVDIEADSTSGRVELICRSVPQKIDAETISGDIDVSLPADAGFTAHLDTVSGDITSDFACKTSGKRLDCGDGACECEFQTTSGDVQIHALG